MVARLNTIAAAAWFKHLPVVLLGALYLFVIGLKAARTGLWFDEITTFYVANSGDTVSIVKALLARADNHPPIDYLARHYAMSLLGPSEFAFRLPSILAILLASICLYLFVLRRFSVLPALVAFAFPLTTFALNYSVEGRPYALLLASACLALLAWQLVTEKQSAPRLIFFTLCLSLGPHVHYYGVLNYLPLAAGEAWRWWEARRISWPVFGCFVVSLLIVALLLPFVLNAAEFAVHFWTRIGPAMMLFIYGDLFSSSVSAVLAAAAGCAILFVFFGEPATPASEIPRFYGSEMIAALGFSFVPVTTYVLKVLVTQAYFDKYLITTVVGVALIAAFLTAHLQAHRRSYGVVIALSLGLWAGWKLVYVGHYAPAKPYALSDQVVKLVEKATLPIVVADAHRYSQIHYYLPPHLREKIIYVTDNKLALNYVGHDTNEIVLRNLQTVVNVRMANLCEFTMRNSRLLILRERATWLERQLLKDGADIKLVYDTGERYEAVQVTMARPSGC